MSQPIGRIRVRLSELLSERLSARIMPENIHPVVGAWKCRDVYRWKCYSDTVPIASWCTMSDCLRHGFSIDRKDPNQIMIWCKGCSTKD